jgi:hypothetical protein
VREPRTAQILRKTGHVDGTQRVSIWFECTACSYPVGGSDSYCKNCGARLLGIKS